MKLKKSVGSEDATEPTEGGGRGFRKILNPRPWVQETPEPTGRGFRKSLNPRAWVQGKPEPTGRGFRKQRMLWFLSRGIPLCDTKLWRVWLDRVCVFLCLSCLRS